MLVSGAQRKSAALCILWSEYTDIHIQNTLIQPHKNMLSFDGHPYSDNGFEMQLLLGRYGCLELPSVGEIPLLCCL